MIIETKVFQNGNSKAIRLPKILGLTQDFLIIKKIEDGILVIEKGKEQNFWKQWWNSFDTAALQREQGSQKREEIF